jgi:predicted permease
MATDFASATSEFFQSMGTPLRSGRLFTPADTLDDAGNVVILNETMARTFWPSENPLGTHIRLTGGSKPGPWREVVGIAGDFRQHNIETPPRPEMFCPSRDFIEMTLVVRTTSDPSSLVPQLEKALGEIDKDQPLSDVQTLEQMVDNSIAERHFDMLLLGGFACLSILLALVGVYGLISYVISSRTRDIGIRITLGAQRQHIFSAMLREIVPYAVIGVFAGLAISFFVKRLVASLLFEMSPLDPLAYVLSPIIILVLTVANCIWPASRATRIDPVNVLRHD